MKKGSWVIFKTLIVVIAALAGGEIVGALLLPFQDVEGALVAAKLIYASVIGIVPLLIYHRWFKKEGWSLGFAHSHKVARFSLGALLGIVFIAGSVWLIVIIGAAQFEGFTHNPAFGGLIFIAASSLLVSLGEETLMRGAVQGLFRHAYGRWAGIVAPSVLFFLIHAGAPGMFDSVFAPLNLLLGGVLLSLLRERTGSLWLPIGFHWTWNVCEEWSGFAVSGFSAKDSLAVVHLVPGMEWLSGGTFGLEGSAVTVCIVALVCIFLGKDLSKGKRKNAAARTA